MNRRGEKPVSLKKDEVPAAPEFVTAVGDDAINRFDEARKRNKKKKKKSGNKPGNRNNKPKKDTPAE
jgi:ribosome assembly protein YihI (activator of Der GTPase)